MAISGIGIDMSYLRYFIEVSIDELKRKAKSMIPGVDRNTVQNLEFSLPPLEEQHRIVAKIEELFPYVDRYATSWAKLEYFNAKFPENMRKSILQYAIQGKLVEQRLEEGTAEELYQQIQAEKQKLIKEGKIKKEKPLEKIAESEIPFDIPESWKWVRLGNISYYIDAGKSPNCKKTPVSGDEWGVITTTAIQNGYFDDIQNKVLPDNYEVNKAMQVHVDDILITRAGPMNRTGVACIVKRIRYNLILSDKTLRINITPKHICRAYVVMILNSPQIRSQLIDRMSGMDKQQVNISQDKYKTVLVPLPPLEEQYRIVAKIEELLPYCDRLVKK
jgi:type I restriction enzyme S subunit